MLHSEIALEQGEFIARIRRAMYERDPIDPLGRVMRRTGTRGGGPSRLDTSQIFNAHMTLKAEIEREQ